MLTGLPTPCSSHKARGLRNLKLRGEDWSWLPGLGRAPAMVPVSNPRGVISGSRGQGEEHGRREEQWLRRRAAFDLLPPTPALAQLWRLLGEPQGMEAPRWRCWAWDCELSLPHRPRRCSSVSSGQMPPSQPTWFPSPKKHTHTHPTPGCCQALGREGWAWKLRSEGLRWLQSPWFLSP